MSLPKVPESILFKLKCVRCKRWLSCGPVRLLPNGGSICGRCEIHREGPRDQYRHFAFEALACYFRFPCKYWGNNCPEFIPFKKVLEHEKKCSYGSSCGLFCTHPSAALKAKRYLNPTAAINLEIIPDVVLEYLRCTNCAGYLSSTPIYVCRDGTSICYRCSAQISQDQNSEFIRDNSFEAFVDIMIFPCIFRYRGCTKILKFGEQMMEHELDCPYGKTYTREQPSSRQLEPESSSRQIERQSSNRQAEPQPFDNRRDFVQGVPSKERGVIKTHSGHIYATITPNAPLFAPQAALNKQEKDMFLDEFQRYRDNLAGKWGIQTNGGSPTRQQSESSDGQNSDGRYSDYNRKPPRHAPNGSFAQADGIPRPSLMSRTDSVYENTQGNPDLIQELRIKQQLRKNPQTNQYSNGQSGGQYSNDKYSNGYPNGNANGQRMERDNRYYHTEEPPRKMDYSVYS